jgi:hypothetical protein
VVYRWAGGGGNVWVSVFLVMVSLVLQLVWVVWGWDTLSGRLKGRVNEMVFLHFIELIELLGPLVFVVFYEYRDFFRENTRDELWFMVLPLLYLGL